MNIIKVRHLSEIPKGYTGVVEWNDAKLSWYKNGKHHREDGPAVIYKEGLKRWYLDGKYVCSSIYRFDFSTQIILSKQQHPEYPLVQVWKILDKDRVYEELIIPGMEEYIQE